MDKTTKIIIAVAILAVLAYVVWYFTQGQGKQPATTILTPQQQSAQSAAYHQSAINAAYADIAENMPFATLYGFS